MAQDKVIPTERVLAGLDLTDPQIHELIQRAQDADATDKKLTVRQALKKYKKAVFWASLLSVSLVMEGYDLVMIGSFYGQTQFQKHFGQYSQAEGKFVITPAWQSGLSNSAQVGQLAGLLINAYSQDRYGARLTMMVFMAYLTVMIFIIAFAPSLSILALGEALCGVAWGVFQTLSTTYACEVVPTVLRPYVTAWVCMCWGFGILLSSGVVRATSDIQSNLAWRLPFYFQWVWPVPLFVVAYFAPESPWNAVRRGKMDEARHSLMRLSTASADKEAAVEATLAYIRHTTELEKAETQGASFWQCFKGTNLRRTEIVSAMPLLPDKANRLELRLFLQAAGWSEVQSFNLNISLSACYIIGGMICWLLFPHVGRATIYMGGLVFMFCCLVAIGGLGWSDSKDTYLAIGLLFVVSTLCNMITIGPVCYPIVAETPSGRLRYKTIVIGRFVYNLTAIFSNVVTPRMISKSGWGWGAKTGLFYAGTNLLCFIWCWFRLPETKDRTFGEIDILFENRVPARKFKSTQVDQFAQHSDYVFNEKASHEQIE
ncbi:hypothetical protein FZEAL_9686 [Fusarium zealandicum]|uniref:Major facilitator superfamily (MFS) profile domain-containing protein n=1 Tax=Fusarium zealandicum TaxID=1053134 RepID=A0A8H4U9R5_9HYPO|nr:hypothetical protein FZEAL_9686 [Fusarium zealandicum]